MHHALKTVARLRGWGLALPALALAAACVHRPTPFERYVEQEQWIEAAREFESDTTVRGNEHDLFAAGVLYGTPGRATYSAQRAHEIWQAFLLRFPLSPRRNEAAERLALVDEVLSTRRDAAARAQELQDQIDRLTHETQGLRARIDSMTVTSDSLKNALQRAEVDRRDREAQLNALKLELQRLKEIDLKPRTTRPIRPYVY